MQKLMREYLNELKNRKKRRRRTQIAVVILVSMVVGSVIGALAQYGVAMTGGAKCGKEEHTHDLDCYEKTLVCTQPESDGHHHTDACYQTETHLVCGLEESEEHTHSDDCYETTESLICGEEEYEGHQHTDACYEDQLVCGKEVHTHSEECYIDTEADVEDANLWNKQYEDLKWKDTWSENLVMAAREQIGYKESADNYTIAEDGSHKGYTRYGQFAVDTGVEGADVYADWDTAFVNFCLFYSGISATNIFPTKMDTVEWYEEFRKINENIDEYLSCLAASEGYTPKAGDIVIFQKGKEEEEREYQMGIVSSYDKEKDELKVIEGNSKNEVKENDYYIEAKDDQDDEMAPVFCYVDMSGIEKAYKGTDEAEEDPVEPGEPVEPEEPKDDKTETEEPKDTADTEDTDGKTDEEENPEEETIELTTEVDGTTITLSGPASSFEEGKKYKIQAEKVEDEEVLATVEEAVEQAAEEKEKKVESFQPYDIKLMLDGEEVQPLGPVEVKFSGKEVKESVENEETEVSVLHVDENTGEAMDMEAIATDEKDVVIETEHFSVYVYVHLTNIYDTVTVTVEHWGQDITTIKGTADASKGVDTVFKKTDTKGEVQTNKVGEAGKFKIYTTDTIELPNEYYGAIEKLSKVCNIKQGEKQHYKIKTIWISSDSENKDGKRENDKTWVGTYQSYNVENPEDSKITLKNGDAIRIWYTPETGNENKSASFYDYDMSNGKFYTDNGKNGQNTQDSTHFYLSTKNKGTNSKLTETANKPTLLIGQEASGNRSEQTWDKYTYEARDTKTNVTRNLNAGNGYVDSAVEDKKKIANVVERIVKDDLEGGANGIVSFNMNTPQNLFTTPTVNYDLIFAREGDTYTLAGVNNGLNNQQDLRTFSRYNDKVYANNFWAMDNWKKGKDPFLAGGCKIVDKGPNEGQGLSNSDDGKNHNWYFGMTYAIDFTIGDYTGPMEYYFRGDDDFWLFIDGKLVVDLGGVHLAVGESLDVRKYLEGVEGTKNLDKNKTHTMKIFYMERGGFGSCCYMQFTLPNSNPVTPVQPDVTECKVTKVWDDGNNPFRPESIEVRLLQDGVETDQKKILDASNNWSHTWTDLPDINGSTGGKYNYTYSVEEIRLPLGYTWSWSDKDVDGDGKLDGDGTLTNKLTPVKVKVKKEWENDGGDKYQPDEITLQLYANGAPYKDRNGNTKTITLNESKGWSDVFEGLPEYYNHRIDPLTGDYTADRVIYTVKEIGENNGLISGKDGAQYAVTYTPSTESGYVASITVKNELLTAFKVLKKGSEEQTNPLPGARFSLTRSVENTETNAIALLADGNVGLQNGESILGERIVKEDITWASEPSYYGESGNDGVLKWLSVDGEEEKTLDEGTYLFQEITAPAGYALSNYKWIIQVGSNGKAKLYKEDGSPIEYDDQVENGAVVFVYTFYNEALYELPSTGGPGTYGYMFSGVLLLAVTALMTYRNKRKEVLRS